MHIDWYPGHMAKAIKQIAEVMRKIDLVFEVLDARLPFSSANPQFEEIRGSKPCVKLLNKNDLADPEITKQWVKFFDSQKRVKALPLESRQRIEVGLLPKLCRRLVPHRGIPGKPLRVMIVGIPNVGKSTLINTLAGKKIARVGDKPAVTTCHQQIDLRNGILLSDTPGMLWPNLGDQRGANRLAATGAIGENAFEYLSVAEFAADYLKNRYPQRIRERYKLEDLPELAHALVEEVGRRRGCLVRGGEVDMERASELFVREIRSGKLGRISFEDPAMIMLERQFQVTG
jgi:ribosome biogenesis GTPase A